MKTTMRGLIFVLSAICEMMLLVGNAEAAVNMPEREQFQTIVWAVEFVSLVTAMAIIWFIWRIGKRDSENNKSKRDTS